MAFIVSFFPAIVFHYINIQQSPLHVTISITPQLIQIAYSQENYA